MYRSRAIAIATLSLVFGAGCFPKPYAEVALYACDPDGGFCPNSLLCEDNVCCTYDSDRKDMPLCPSCGQPCADSTRVGVCQVGKWQCLPGGERVCGQDLSPEAELCDGKDNDCNGTIDNGADQGCGGGLCLAGACCSFDGVGAPPCPGCGEPCVDLSFKGECRDGGVFQCTADAGLCAQTVFPQTEICDGKDNDCDGTIDDGADSACPTGHCENGSCCTYDSDAGTLCPSCSGSCMEPTRPLACRPGVTQCLGGVKTCAPTPQQTEICDGIDNNCAGGIDERPYCKGPLTFANDPTVAFGAKHLATAYNGITTGCVKDAPASATLPDAVTLNASSFPSYPAIHWVGTGATSHVFWAEALQGAWDLSLTGTSMSTEFQIWRDTTGSVWAAHAQPVFLVCSPAGYLRLAYSAPFIPQDNNAYSYEGFGPFPLRGGGGWSIQPGSSANVDAVLRQVQRIEVLMQPGTASPSVDFWFDFLRAKWGLP